MKTPFAISLGKVRRSQKVLYTKHTVYINQRLNRENILKMTYYPVAEPGFDLGGGRGHCQRGRGVENHFKACFGRISIIIML